MLSRPRRAYRTAGVAEADGAFAIVLDGRPVRTPAKAPLAVPSRALAEAIACEWQAQGERVDPDSMPLTRIASIAIDLVAPRRDSVIAEIAKYAGTDLVCYRAERPPELVARQHATWQPLVQLDARALWRRACGDGRNRADGSAGAGAPRACRCCRGARTR